MSDLPVKKENFLAEAEVMDLSHLRDLTFVVAVGNGDPNSVSFLCSTMHGPYTFVEMLQEVGDMWMNHQHHAKVIVLEKNSEKAVKMLDENTIDYIELRYNDIITEEMLAGVFDADKDFTCQAGFVEDGTDPRKPKREEDAPEQDPMP